MVRKLAATLVVAVLIWSVTPLRAAAGGPDDPPPGWTPPTPRPTPTATAAPSPTPSPSAGPTPSPAGSATAIPTASASGMPSPSVVPTASPTPDPQAARAADAAQLASASSLAQIVGAQARIARDEIAALGEQIAQASDDQDRVAGDLAVLQQRIDERHAERDRAVRQALRVAVPDSARPPAALSDVERDAIEEVATLESGLHDHRARLADRQETLAQLRGSVIAKQAQLARLSARAAALAAATHDGDESERAAEIAVLRVIANEATQVEVALAQLVAAAIPPAGPEPTAWSLPVRGPITQPFGPTALALEPALAYRGVLYEHFHAAIDVAAPLGTPVTAAADGQVTFVGHLPDGAEIVLVAHADGLVSEYAHLDDTFARPPVKVGQDVRRGQVVGFVGLTGITTGAHVHFAIRSVGGPLDPLTVIAGVAD